jgi:hypothetical protein
MPPAPPCTLHRTPEAHVHLTYHTPRYTFPALCAHIDLLKWCGLTRSRRLPGVAAFALRHVGPACLLATGQGRFQGCRQPQQPVAALAPAAPAAHALMFARNVVAELRSNASPVGKSRPSKPNVRHAGRSSGVGKPGEPGGSGTARSNHGPGMDDAASLLTAGTLLDASEEWLPWYLLNPSTKLSLGWELFVAVLILYSVINVPFNLAFQVGDPSPTPPASSSALRRLAHPRGSVVSGLGTRMGGRCVWGVGTQAWPGRVVNPRGVGTCCVRLRLVCPPLGDPNRAAMFQPLSSSG